MISQRESSVPVSFLFLLLLELFCVSAFAKDLGQLGPSFLIEPKDRVRFYNSTGVVVPCSATGVPQPVISWIRQDGSKVHDVPNLLHTRTDGSLVLTPFSPEKFRQDLHAASYRCTATNVVGVISSREISVRAVIREQYEIRTYDDFVVKGNTAVLKCYIPNAVKDFVKVVSWETDDGYIVQKGSVEGKKKISADGSLIIETADLNDGKRRYRCLCRDEMNKETVTSTTWGQLIVTEPTTLLIPRIRSGDHEVKFIAGGSAEMNCIAQGYPVPTYAWYKQDGPRLIPLATNRRFQVVRSKLLLHKARPHDLGTYICVANNTAGEDRVHIQLILDEPLRVTVHPPRLTVKEGMTVTFACNVTGPPASSLVWMKNLKPVVASTRSKLISSDVLQIYAVQREDRGMYQCFVRSHDVTAQGSAQLSLEEDPPEFREVFSDQLLRPGSRISLRCLVTGNPLPQVSWRIYSRPVLESPSLRIGDFVDAQGILTSFINISNVNSEHGGLYSCHARNEIGAISHSAKLSIYGAPYVHPMDNITVVTGDDVHVECAVSGYPITSVVWERNNTLIGGGARITDYKNGTLSIAQATKEDQGWYQCEIIGGQSDKAEGSLFIKVTERPMINPFQFSDDLVENMRSMVLCNVLAGEPPINIVWLKDNVPLLHSSQREGIHVSSLGEFASSLTIPSVTRHHAGNYTCLVTSGAAQTSYTSSMTVRASPKWVKKSVDQEAVVGQKVMFSCQAEGIPDPVHRWKYKSDDAGTQEEFRSVISSSHMYVLENGSLVIKDVGKADAGSYLCEANNGVGSALSAVVSLSVNVPPRFNQSFEVRTVQEKQEVTLSCQPSGEAPITLKWKRYQRPIDRSILSRYVLRENVLPTGIQSEVTIPSVLRTDSGLFSCEASNAFGKDEKSIQLIVQAAPESPDSLQLLQVTSRQVTFSWAVPSSGNSPITGYVVVYNKSKAQDDPLESSRISASETKVTITNLIPGTSYIFRVHAENAIGQSPSSQELTVVTHEEAPSHAPQQVRVSAVSSSAVKVTWKSPMTAYSSDLLGYYVGTRDVSSSEPVVYKTIDFSKEDALNEALITNLRKHTKYAVTVQAYNSKGTGPVSKEAFVQTLEHDPPKSPSLRVENTSSFSIQLSWTVADLSPVTGYILQYRSETGDWAQESHVAPQRTSATIKNLRCGTKYHFILSAFNSAGRGEPSDEVTAETTGGASVAPEKSALLSVNSTSAHLRLSSWQDSGCPILYFVVQYKPQLQGDWILLSNNIVPAQSTVLITDLTPGTWYDLLMAAHNDAGTTEAEYVFSTLTSGGATVPPLTSYSPSSVISFLRDPTVLVPIVCAVVVVVVITVVVAVVVVLRRKDTPSDCRSQGVYSGSSGGKGENLSMSSYGKVKRCDPSDDSQRETLYYPTPYATTQLSTYSESPDISQCNTLRRHEGKGHDYDIPHRHTQMGDYTSYAKLWTRKIANPEAAGDLQLIPIGPDDEHLNTLLQSYVGAENGADGVFACEIADVNEAEEFSETECDRHHKWILFRDARISNAFDENILDVPRVC